MKATLFQQAQKVGLAAAIALLSYQPAMNASTSELVNPSPTAPSIDTLVAAAPPIQLAQAQGATFVGSDGHDTQGGAHIVEENGQRYLEFDEAFSSDSGPDLFVLLHREAAPTSYDPANYVNLGRIQSLNGTQRYAIPADVDISEFQSAVIWCQQFNVTFGYATL